MFILPIIASLLVPLTSYGQALSDEQAMTLGTEAYIYGYPLVTMEMTRRIMTNVEDPRGTRAPMAQFVRMRSYPDASFHDVTAPNADTLYSTAWLDVGREPYVLSLPDMDGRYFLMPMLSGWTDVFAVPGTRTTGARAQTFVITGPVWKGELPGGARELKSPTNLVWILGRTYCTGTAEDFKTCHALMDEYTLVPLSAYGKTHAPPTGRVDPSVDMKTPVRDQVHALTTSDFFGMMAALMKDNPPAADDAEMLKTLAAIGVVPGRPFDSSKLSADVAKHIPAAAQKQILGHMRQAGSDRNGWVFTTKTGIYGTDYLQRALITAIGLGANRPQDAVYPTSELDVEGKPYLGSNKYVMHFPKSQAPPVKGFWSLTMYDARYFFVANPLNKYTISERDALRYNDDGSFDIYIQHESPGVDKEANWLPAPKDRFILMLRLYWPRETPPSILDGSWSPPEVRKTDAG